MQRKYMKKLTAFVLALAMIIGVLPMNVFAYKSETHDTFKRTTSTIAPGVTQDVCYAYAKDGKQMVYYVATADIKRDDVVVQTSYKDQYVNKKFGMEKLTNQMAYADSLYTDSTSDRYISDYYKAVVGVNASFYNMQTGQPSGITYLDGIAIGESASYNQCFAILKDGTAIVDYTKNVNKDDIWQAVAGSQMIVYGGKDVTADINGAYNTDRHSRTCVGVTADGKVVVMSLDGRQEPFSCGGTMHELAQIMLEAGCVAAINLDGGGSTTFASRPEGENDVKVINRPSDGSERSISAGIIIASTAAPSNVFDRAVLKAENDYVTPGSTVKVTATGVSPAGTAADIPENAVWALEDDSFGTIKDGVFVSNGSVGDAKIQLLVDGNVVGTTVVRVVIPDKLMFNQSEIVVPFDKTVTLDIQATYGLNEVTLKDDDLKFEFSDTTVGKMEGLKFTAGSQETAGTESTVTATLVHNDAITASSKIVLGKGSDVIADFEDGTTQGFKVEHITNYNYKFPSMDVTAATSENGKVHGGNGALKVVPDFSNSTEGGYMGTGLGVEKDIVIEGALTLGMWIYMPEESEGIRLRACLYNENNTRFTTEFMPIGKASTLDKPGWHYVTFDLSKYPYAKIMAGKVFIEFYVSDRDDITNYNYNHLDYNSLNTRLCFYIDDITVDYSSAIDDREAPVFSSVRYSDTAMSDAVELNGQTIASNVLSFGAVVHENTTKNNYTGLDESTAKAYVDGVEVPCTISGGIMSVADMSLADGMHTVKFTIRDKMGNEGFVTRTLNVQSGSSIPTVRLNAHDETLDKILLGSLYYVDLVATDAEKVKTIEVDLDLNNISRWQLDHMEVAEGFEAEYTIDSDDNIATVKVTCVDKHELTGENILVSMPIRTWELPIAPIEGGTKVGQVFTYATYKAGSETWPIDINVSVDRGVLTLKDDTVSTFAGENIQVDTESYVWDNDVKPEGYAQWDGGHDHRVETAQYYAKDATNVSTPIELEDKPATCTEDGYTGRTFCEKCNSVVDWGTTLEATDHVYKVVDDTLACSCGETITENGLYENGDDTYYVWNGVLKKGWVAVGDDNYYFGDDYKAVDGEQKIDGYKFKFKDKVLYEGEFVTTSKGLQYRWANTWMKRSWFEYQGDTYYADLNSCIATGLFLINLSNNGYEVHLFEEDGKYIRQAVEDGLVAHMNEVSYVKDGLAYYAGLVQDADGNYYYINSKLKAVKNCTYGIGSAKTNGLLSAGTYEFGADGKMINAPTEEPENPEEPVLSGIVKDADGEIRYYKDGVAVYAGLVKDDDGNYYYINSTKKAVKNCTYGIGSAKTNGLLPAGTYEFGADGKMINASTEEPEDPEEPVLSGIVKDADGEIRYYKDGAAVYAGLVQDAEGNYYYINSTKKAVKNCTYGIGSAKTNGLLPAGKYEFGADGKMILN